MMKSLLITKEHDGREGEGIILKCGYFPPDKSHEMDHNDTLNKIKVVARRFGGVPKIIFGDFNLERDAFAVKVKVSLGI